MLFFLSLIDLNIRAGIPALSNDFSPAVYGSSFLNEVGKGQQSSYSERIYTSPVYMSYYERIG